VGELFGEERLARADRFAARIPQRGVPEPADGSYRFEPLPHLAQIALCRAWWPAISTAMATRIFTRSKTPMRPFPRRRFDGGLSQLLRGDGAGHFAAVAPAESNLVVHAMRRRWSPSTWMMMAGRISSYRGTTTPRCFRKSRHRGHNSLRVMLRGPAGIPRRSERGWRSTSRTDQPRPARSMRVQAITASPRPHVSSAIWIPIRPKESAFVGRQARRPNRIASEGKNAHARRSGNPALTIELPSDDAFGTG